MSSYSSTYVILLLTAFCGLALSQIASYQEKCQTGLTADHRTLDTCDSTKFLKCRSERCECADPKNQLWTSAFVKANSRQKRGKKGFGKGVATGAVLGAAGGYIGGRLASGGGSSSSGSSSNGGSGSSKSKDKYIKTYSCFSRVQGSCLLPNAHGSNVVVAVNRPADVPAPAAAAAVNGTVPGADSNATAYTATPSPAGVTYDVLSLPSCVQHAECRPAVVKIVDGKVVEGGSGDPRIGACQCVAGFKANNMDICVSVSGGLKTGAGALLMALCFLVTFINRSKY